ncbi:hypothetical protein [Stanieria cyanosphaera]|nr:hypothetical protein [Stanieria cyanosphaera]
MVYLTKSEKGYSCCHNYSVFNILNIMRSRLGAAFQKAIALQF